MTTPLRPGIRRAEPADINGLSLLLADAFLIAPVSDWLIPDINQRREVYIRYFEIFVRHGLRRGLIEVTNDLTGVAIWHPHGVFHHHFAFIAVSPGMQRRGTGSALLAHHHSWLDRKGIPAYLEASMPRNRDLYLEHGYDIRGVFHLPDDGPPLWCMWRDPKPDPTYEHPAE